MVALLVRKRRIVKLGLSARPACTAARACIQLAEPRQGSREIEMRKG